MVLFVWAGQTRLSAKAEAQDVRQRAPGPGPIRKVEWSPIANCVLKGRKVVLRTDSAKSYKLKAEGVLHDRVIHCNKRVKVNGSWKLKMPTYVKIISHKDPQRFKVNRAWRFLKSKTELNQRSKVGSL